MSSGKKGKKKEKFESSPCSDKSRRSVATPCEIPVVSVEKLPTAVSTVSMVDPGSSSTCIKSAMISSGILSVDVEMSPTKPSPVFVRNGAPPSCSPSSTTETKGLKRSLIGYVHGVSPIKGNRQNTVDYFDISLQTEQRDKQKVLCYEKSKRALFQGRQESKTAVKLTNFTTSANRDAVFVNSMTRVTELQPGEYSFFFVHIQNNIQNNRRGKKLHNYLH